MIKKILYDFLRGIAMGVANVIPGFCGGTVAIILNFYERFVNAIGILFEHPIKALKDIWAILIGLVTGIILAIILIVKLLELFPVPTMMFIVGLVIGSIPQIYKIAKTHGKIKLGDYIAIIIAAIVVTIFALLKPEETNNETINIWMLVVLFICGIICAIAMIVPGVSGSLLLMTLGYYTYITTKLKNIFESFFQWNLNSLFDNLLVVGIFALGALIGIVVSSKVISYLFKKHAKVVYFSILGLLLASPFAVIYAMIMEYNEIIVETSPLSYAIAVLCLAVGTYAAYALSSYEPHLKIEEK